MEHAGRAGSILVCDIARWTLGSIERQCEAAQALQSLLRRARPAVGTWHHFKCTGDGALVTFHGDQGHIQAHRLAVWLHRYAPRRGLVLRT